MQYQYLIFSVITSFVIALAAGYVLIPMLKRLKFGQQVRDDGPQTHLSKAGTPTMGGLIMLIALIITTFIFARGSYQYVVFLLAVTVGFALIGFVDDLIIVVRKRSLGLKAYQKLIGQFGIALIVALYAYFDPDIGSKLYVPVFNVYWDLGIWFIPVTVIVLVGWVNGVNLTDGLDGLASGVTLINAAAFSLIFLGMSMAAMTSGQTLHGMNLTNAMIFSAALAGSCLGFLRYNSYPARVFMGDTGSFTLGAALALMAIVSRLQLLLPIMGLMFLLTIVSVILQVGSYKLRKKRIFKMAPLHHHFELSGVAETKIVAVYMIITTILSLMCILVIN
jgi:phospho-N-acetylmuramoyl-pentapeptide-transferase